MEATHPLDRPIWSALTGPQASLARGSQAACRLDPAMGWFAAAARPEDSSAIVALATAETPLVLFEDAPFPADQGFTVRADEMVQMVADRLDPPDPGPAVVPLGDADAPEMLALATLTRPGPFLAGTHRFGGFVGIREGDTLVAMAGTRLRMPGFVEVSGVCTHPDHRGQGHGARLIRAVAGAIVAGGDRPCLHSYARNTAAIGLYERLGFRERRRLTVSFVGMP